jgi:hypothetical protein
MAGMDSDCGRILSQLTGDVLLALDMDFPTDRTAERPLRTVEEEPALEDSSGRLDRALLRIGCWPPTRIDAAVIASLTDPWVWPAQSRYLPTRSIQEAERVGRVKAMP